MALQVLTTVLLVFLLCPKESVSAPAGLLSGIPVLGPLLNSFTGLGGGMPATVTGLGGGMPATVTSLGGGLPSTVGGIVETLPGLGGGMPGAVTSQVTHYLPAGTVTSLAGGMPHYLPAGVEGNVETWPAGTIVSSVTPLREKRSLAGDILDGTGQIISGIGQILGDAEESAPKVPDEEVVPVVDAEVDVNPEERKKRSPLLPNLGLGLLGGSQRGGLLDTLVGSLAAPVVHTAASIVPLKRKKRSPILPNLGVPRPVVSIPASEIVLGVPLVPNVEISGTRGGLLSAVGDTVHTVLDAVKEAVPPVLDAAGGVVPLVTGTVRTAETLVPVASPLRKKRAPVPNILDAHVLHPHLHHHV